MSAETKITSLHQMAHSELLYHVIQYPYSRLIGLTFITFPEAMTNKCAQMWQQQLLLLSEPQCCQLQGHFI